MSDRIALIARIGAAIATADAATQDVLRDALTALVEDHSIVAAVENRKRKDRVRKRSADSVDSTDSNDSTESKESRDSADPPSPPSPPLSSPTPLINPSSPAPSPATLSRATGVSAGVSAGVAAGDDPAEPLLRTLMGEHMPAVEDFLRTRPPASRRRWYAELLRIVGPATGNLPEDLSAACSDALLVQPPVAAPGPLRDFVTKHRLQRLGQTGARRNGNGAHGDGSRSPRLEEDTGADVLASIRELIEHTNTPGQGAKPFIRLADVERLGPRAVAAYREIGGADRILGTTPDKIGLLSRDWGVAWRRAASAAAAATAATAATEQAHPSRNGTTP